MNKVNYRIAIVDDSKFIRMTIRKSLQGLPNCTFEPVEFENGKLALDFLTQDNTIELIITDIQMPEMDGLELLRKVRLLPHYKNIPILTLTGIDQETAKLEAFEYGATDFLTKPFLVPELRARTLGYLERQRHLQALEEEIEARKLAESALMDSFSTIKEQQEQIQEDLLMAEEVQKKFFKHFSVPDFLKINLHYQPHSHVSGDVYHCNINSHGEFDLFLGDATGHGTAAALTTIMAKMALIEKSEERDLVKILLNLNELFEAHLSEDRFISGVFLRISANGQVRLSSGGHPAMIVVPADGSALQTYKSNGGLLGLFPNDMVNFNEIAFQLQPGDRGFVYTDGITELKNEAEELFGMQRLCEFLAKYRQEDSQKIIELLLTEMSDFCLDAKPDDDITLIVFDYRR